MRPLTFISFAAAASAAFAASAHAGAVQEHPAGAASAASRWSAQASAPQDTAAPLPVRLDSDELEDSRGRATIVVNDQEIDGTVTDNALGDYSAGAIALSDNALSNFSGVGNFLFNTGAQNNLQAGMTLTIIVDD